MERSAGHLLLLLLLEQQLRLLLQRPLPPPTPRSRPPRRRPRPPRCPRCPQCPRCPRWGRGLVGGVRLGGCGCAHRAGAPPRAVASPQEARLLQNLCMVQFQSVENLSHRLY